MWVLDEMVLPREVVMTPAGHLTAADRSRLGAGEAGFVVRRAGTDAPALSLDAEMAPLVERFRTPRKIVDAIVEYSDERQLDAEATLDEVYPVLERLMKAGLMRPAGRQEARFAADLLRRLHVPAIPATPPRSGVTYGAAGVAYGLYHVARSRRDPRLLELASQWVQGAWEVRNEEGAFFNAPTLTEAKVGSVTPYHTETGVEAVRALVSHARGDTSTRDAAVAGFVRAARRPCGTLDLTLGRAGVLLVTALLVREIGAGSMAPELLALGSDTADSIRDRLRPLPPVREDRTVGFLGVAHGWGGLLYASLAWSRSVGEPPSPWAVERLGQLAELGEPHGQGLRWPRHLGLPETSRYLPTWCHGAAGLVHLWVLAYRALHEERYLEVAERGAWNGWEDGDPRIAHLCCGLAGRAYGLLSLYKATGEPAWLERARRLASAAVDRESEANSTHPFSLYKGSLGTAVLVADLERPERAFMPFFELPT